MSLRCLPPLLLLVPLSLATSPLPILPPAAAAPTATGAPSLEPPSSAAGLSLDLDPLLQLTGKPPTDGSTALSEDLAVLRWLQRNRTPEMVTTTWTTLARDLAVFSPALGVDMDKTTPLLLRGMAPFMALVDQGNEAIKNRLRRPRPFSSHPDLQPCLPLETGYSFPSGHASWYAAAAWLLSDLLPERRERILAIGSYGGANRVMCGVHYPSDVLAAQRFARGVAAQITSSPQWQRFRTDPTIQAELDEVRSLVPASLPLLLR